MPPAVTYATTHRPSVRLPHGVVHFRTARAVGAGAGVAGFAARGPATGALARPVGVLGRSPGAAGRSPAASRCAASSSAQQLHARGH